MMWLTRMMVMDELASKLKLNDCYDWHRAVWQLFPNMPDAKRCFLFRFDRNESGFVLLVLSTETPKMPDWCQNDQWLVKEIDDSFLNYKHYRFDMRVNVTRRYKMRDMAIDGKIGKRRKFVVTSAEEQRKWLIRKGEEHGFKLHEDAFSWLEIEPSEDFCFSRQGKSGIVVGSKFRGVLEVVDIAKFRQTLYTGIGSARSFGFGLLMIQPTFILN